MSDEAVELGSDGVLGDGGVDVQCQCERGAAFLAGNSRLLAGAYAFQKRFDSRRSGSPGVTVGLESARPLRMRAGSGGAGQKRVVA